MEIGSEFHQNSNPFGVNRYKDLCGEKHEKMYMSFGRECLTVIAQDMKKKRKAKMVALPEYCCSSMIIPFIENNMQVVFYSISSFNAIEVTDMFEKEIWEADAVLLMDYFGFVRVVASKLFEIAQSAGKLIIVDATQTAFSKTDLYHNADYVFASYRKWADVLCSVLYCKNGLAERGILTVNSAYENAWREAAKIKAEYIMGKALKKRSFLEKYNFANDLISLKNNLHTPSEAEIYRFENMNSDFLIQRRRNNAVSLLTKAKLIDGVELIFDVLGEEDCPLFLPVLIPSKQRGAVHSYMVSKDIYCPIHWPVDNSYCRKSKWHESELSLICDQRYGKDEIAYELDVLASAVGGRQER